MRTEKEIREMLTERTKELRYDVAPEKREWDLSENAMKEFKIYGYEVSWIKDHAFKLGAIDALKYAVGDESESVMPFPDTEIEMTGGNCWTGVARLNDGTWFAGMVNEFGCVFKSHAAAWGSEMGDDDIIRDVEDINEQREIWKHIYTKELAKQNLSDWYREFIVSLLMSLEDDLKSMWCGG